MHSKIKHCLRFKKFPISTVGLADKITSIFLIAILIGSVGATGSLYSTQIQLNKDQLIPNGPTLFPTLKVANALHNNHHDPDSKNCKSDEMEAEELDAIFAGNSGLQKDHPIFDFNSSEVEENMLKVKRGGPNNNETKVHVHSPFGKMIQDKQKNSDENRNVEVNCHKLLNIKRTIHNGTHFNFTIDSFTSLKIKPDPEHGNNRDDVGPWGEVMVKNTFVSNATDLGRNLTDFTTAEVFLDSLTNTDIYDIGEFIYSNSTSDTVGLKHIRQFNNYTNFASLGENVTGSELGDSPLVNFNSTVRYYDNNGDGLFSANETVYHDIDDSKNVTEIDVRLANAQFVDDRTDEPFVDGEKANFPNDQIGIMNFMNFISNCVEGENMGIYNVTSDTCDYTKKYGMYITEGFKDKNMSVKFKNKGFDQKLPVVEFMDNVVFLDSRTQNGKFDIGETIYRHEGIVDKVQKNDTRLANSPIYLNGSKVMGMDDDNGDEPLIPFVNMAKPPKFHDKNDNGVFDVGETVYTDTKNPNRVDAGEIRLVNARSVGDFEEFPDGSEVYRRGMFVDDSGMGNGNGGNGDDIEIGMEDRQFNITETLVLQVPMNNTNSSAAIFDHAVSSLSSSLPFDEILAEDSAIPQDPVEKIILFGDTIAPFVTYRFGIDIESCFWILGCITWFKFIIAITPFVITGFRLPGKVRASGFPDRAFAEESFDITTEFETFDASYLEYKEEICEDPNNSLQAQGSYFGPNTPFDCKDFASYDMMSIPDVIGKITDDLENKLLAATELPITQQKITEAAEAFLAVGQILFDPLPPLSVDQFVDRLENSGLDLGDGTNEVEAASFIQGQEVVLKVGVIIEVELVILNIELVDTETRIEIDVLGILQGFLLYNEIVKSSSPLIYKADYAKKTCEPLLAGPGGFKGDTLVGFKSDEKFADRSLPVNNEFDKGESIYIDKGSIGFLDKANDILLLEGDAVDNEGIPMKTFDSNQRHTEDVNENGKFDEGESVYLDTGIPGSNISGKIDCNQAPGTKADYRAIWNLIRNYELMKEKGIIFTSFKAPFGFDEDGSIEGFPFLGGSSVPVLSGPTPYNILYLRGNCIEAWNAGQILKIPAPYGPLPLCSGLYAPGVGQAIFGVQSQIGSLEIDATISGVGDAEAFDADGVFECDEPNFRPEYVEDTDDPRWEQISYCAYLDDPDTNGTKSSLVTRTVIVDNHDGTTDIANIKIDDFQYQLSWIIIGDLLVHFEDPAKFFLPEDMHRLKVNMFTKSIPIATIPQHPRVAGLEGADVKVFNYALEVSDFDGDEPINRPNGTKPIKAENFTLQGLTSYEERSFANVTYRNIGNSLDTIQNLTISFPNLPLLNPNSTDDERWMSNPNQTELDMMNVDPFNGTESPTGSGTDFYPLDIAIKPARHWTTTPSFADNGDEQAGLYNVTVFASSANATKRMMNPTDPIPNFRINAPNIIQVNVTQFGNPQLNFTENATETKPSKLTEYNANIANFGNDFDVINFTQTFEDSNTSNCDLFDKGPDNPNCPFRANYTALQFNWTTSQVLCDYYWNETLPCDDTTINMEEPPAQTPNYNRGEFGLNVTDSRNQTFTIQVPANWAGIDDTLYQLKGVVVSMEDKRDGTDTEFLNHTVIATKESSVRYITLEINAMKDKVTNASVPEMIDKGSQTALTQILDRAIETSNERAFANVCDGNFRGTNGGLMTAQHQLEGMVRAINGMSPSNIRVEFAEELISNANATINDIDDAVANGEESAVDCLDDFSKTTGPSKKNDLDRIRVLTVETTEDSVTLPSGSRDKGVQTEETLSSEDSVTLPSDVDLKDIDKSSSSSSGDTTEPQIVSGILSSSTGLAETLTLDSDNTTPTIFETGKKIGFELEFYENSGTGIEHFELVTKIPEHKTIYDSELSIEYNKGQKPIINNPEGLWSSASISVKGDGKNPKVMVSMVFDKPMETSDVILRVWDAKRNSIDIEFENIIKVIESPKSEIILKPELEIDPEPVFSWERFDEWAGYSKSDLTDEEFLKHLEIDGDNIPSWIKQNNAKWVKQGLISQDELVIALENLENRGII